VTREPRPPSRHASLREGLTVFEPARLALHGLHLISQPRGDGRTVFVLPGLGGGDGSTVPIRGYLRGLGYDARGWGLGTNTGGVAAFVRSMIDQLEPLVASAGRPIPLVGWSLGGVVCREVARERTDLVEQVITFGSPIVGGPKYTRVGAAYAARGGDVDGIARLVDQRNTRLITVPVTAIYTKTDGVVGWRACIDDITPGARNVEVHTTHLGLGLHHRVFVEVARRLHDARPR
jgi:pimeloyl-ACP methyl ester carboxylesterase